MRDVSVREQAVEVLGQRLALPVILAPVGLGGMFARRAEVQAARAAEHGRRAVRRVDASRSAASRRSRGRPRRPPWFQLYVMRDRGYAEELMARAQAVGVAGARADRRPGRGRRPPPGHAQRGRRATPPAWAKLLRGLDIAAHPRWIRDVPLAGKPLTFGNLERAVPGARTPAAFRDWVDAQFDPSVTWNDVAWVREHWDGKLVVKGVLDPEDARRAVEAGVDGIVVSNHGGRQLDSVPSTARALPEVVDAVGDQVEVLADGGVRTGLDVVKMVALGARAVLIGRAWAWAVAARGEQGVRHVLEVHEGRHRRRARPHGPHLDRRGRPLRAVPAEATPARRLPFDRSPAAARAGCGRRFGRRPRRRRSCSCRAPCPRARARVPGRCGSRRSPRSAARSASASRAWISMSVDWP